MTKSLRAGARAFVAEVVDLGASAPRDYSGTDARAPAEVDDLGYNGRVGQ